MSIPRVREAIEHLSAAISADPMKARAKNVPATARLTEGLRCELSGPYNERLVTDMAPAMGGTASGPNPGWLLRGAIASCTATVIAMRAAKLGVALSNLEVTVETDSDLRGILGLDENVSAGHGPVRMKVKIGAPTASPEVLREIVTWADRHSPVTCTDEAGAAMLARDPGRLILLRRRCVALDPRGDENALQVVEQRARIAHELRRSDVRGSVHDTSGQRRQVVRADGQRASLDAMRGAAQRGAGRRSRAQPAARRCRRARPTPARASTSAMPSRAAGELLDARAVDRVRGRRADGAGAAGAVLSDASLPSHCVSFARRLASSAGLVR